MAINDLLINEVALSRGTGKIDVESASVSPLESDRMAANEPDNHLSLTSQPRVRRSVTLVE
jgi:hypothetical protein